MIRNRICVLFAAMCLLLAATVFSQTRQAMTLVDLLETPRLTDPQLSPDGSQLLYVLGRADWNANQMQTHIWRVNSDGGNTVQLTNGSSGELSPRWSPSGETIAFLAKRGPTEESQIYLLGNGGGEASKLTAHPTAVSDIAWSSDGSSLYFLALDEKSLEQRSRESKNDDVYAFEEQLEQQHLWMVAVSTGKTTRVTEGGYSILAYNLSRDGRRVAFHRAPNPVLEYRDASEVWLMNSDGSMPVRLTNNDVPESGARVSPDGSQVLFRSRSNGRFEKYYNSNVFLVSAAGTTTQMLADELPYEFTAAEWSEDGRSLFVVANMGLHSELLRLDSVTGMSEPLTEGQHSIGSWTLVPSADQHILTIREPNNPGDVWLLATDTGSMLRRVTRVFDYLARDFHLPHQEGVDWTGADGVSVEGLLFYPLDYEEGRRYPLVIQTHGGPQASDKFGFGSSRNYTPVLSAMGYFVLQPNYRGSTGYGDVFLRDMVDGYFTNAHLDVLAGADHLIASSLVDGDRMAKMGWSGGGHMTNKVITHTGRFKAASSGAGAANWISMYAQSDTRSQRTPWFGGTPWQVDAPTDLYWEHSPLKHVSGVTTPTIFLVGEDDLRVPMPQSVEMHRALKSLGVPTHLYVAPREGHGWRELRHQLFKMNVELDWFEQYVTDRPYTWEIAPVDRP
ncbi:MAG: hypothetical protein CL484_08225 [Acidobacteria bacterium]|nr:hypothetical protein [Acidobacteriota bacterium]